MSTSLPNDRRPPSSSNLPPIQRERIGYGQRSGGDQLEEEEDDIPPERPLFRSMLVAPPAAEPFARVSPRDYGPVSPGVWGTPQPDFTLSKKVWTSNTKVAPVAFGGRSKATPLAETPASSSVWSTSKQKLPRLGYYHPLEQTHISFPKERLDAILQVLAQSFRDLSCHVCYEDDTLAAECRTMEQVEFFVSLFESRKDKTKVLLELQRRSGDSFVYHQDYVRPIFASVKAEASGGCPAPCRGQASCMDRLLHHRMGGQDSPDESEMAVEMAAKLVANDRVDARRLGMESLISLTDEEKSGRSTASRIARALVNPENDASRRLSVSLLKLLMEGNPTSDRLFDLSYETLHVWANVWQVAADDPNTSLETFCEVSCPAEALVGNLMNHVQNAAKEPHKATQALRGLSALCQAMPKLRSSISWSCIEVAQQVGTNEHAVLATVSGRLLQTAAV